MSENSPIVSGLDYLKLPRPLDTWLIKPIVPSGGTVLLYGDPKVGKSFAALQLALSLSQGGDWLGFPVIHTGRVVYVQLDTPRSLWAERLEILKSHGARIDLLELADRETLGCFPFDILDPSHSLLLSCALKEINPSVVIIDTIRESHQTEENDSTTMKKVLSSLISTVRPAALVVVAHSKKPGMEGSDLLNDNRGSGYVVGAVDTILKMTKRHLEFTGRAVEEGKIKIRRVPSGLWELDSNEIDQHVKKVLSDASLTSLLQRAHELSKLSGKDVEACRSILRRHVDSPQRWSNEPLVIDVTSGLEGVTDLDPTVWKVVG